MIISEIEDGELIRRFRGEGLYYRVGPFLIRGRSRIDSASRGLADLYADFPVAGSDEITDVDYVLSDCGVWFTRCNLILDGRLQYPRIVRRLAVPFVEWALNVGVLQGFHQFFVLHAGVVERGGRVAIFPGVAGKGKSTLTAALVSRGWRLLSDEAALIDPADGLIHPAPRPISLKNESVDLIRRFAPKARLGPSWPGTVKGIVSHMVPPAESVARALERAKPGWMIFPMYTPGASPEMHPCSKARALVTAGDQAFNYGLLGRRGFEVLANLIEACDCYKFVYSDLEGAVAAMNALTITSSAACEVSSVNATEPEPVR